MSDVPQEGHFYTMSENKRYRDRSWCHDIWEVLAANGTHAAIKNAAPRYSSSFGRVPMVVPICEFDWTQADSLLAAIAQDGATVSEAAQKFVGGTNT